MAAKIYLSAGHCGKRTGASSIYGDEGALAIEFRNLVAEKLKAKGRICYLDNEKASLLSVINDINAKLFPGDIAIEFHFDSSTKKDANGSSVHIANKAGVITCQYAEEIANILSVFLNTKRIGVRRESQSQHNVLGFVSKTRPHAMIVELCFISNKEDMEKYHNNKDKLAEAIATFLNMK